jgi:hypothetical protein
VVKTSLGTPKFLIGTPETRTPGVPEVWGPMGAGAGDWSVSAPTFGWSRRVRGHQKISWGHLKLAGHKHLKFEAPWGREGEGEGWVHWCPRLGVVKASLGTPKFHVGTLHSSHSNLLELLGLLFSVCALWGRDGGAGGLSIWCPHVWVFMARMGTQEIRLGTLQNRLPELLMCSLAYS